MKNRAFAQHTGTAQFHYSYHTTFWQGNAKFEQNVI